MKRLIFIIILLIMIFAMCGCRQQTTTPDDTEPKRLTVVYIGFNEVIYQDNNTGVQYLSRINAGTCVMVNPDGTPYIGR